MSKRKLTIQQGWRVKKIQEERIARANKRESHIAQMLEDDALGPEQPGLVIAHYGTQLDIEPIGQPDKVCRCYFRTNLPTLVTGDKVIWRASEKEQHSGIVVAHQLRQSLLSRPNKQGVLKPVAANIHYIVIVLAPVPTPFANLIDRYLVAAETIGIEPVILLNKTDLINAKNRAELDAMMTIYEKIGYKVLKASSYQEEGLALLKQLLNQHTSVFVGQSGVGKSSLINALLPEENLRIGELSEARGKGTHTTTAARLFRFPSGGCLIDSPGIREFGLWHMDRQEVIQGFRDIRPFIGHCRFRDCKHENEPGCAIHQAEQQGEISSQRITSYRQIIDSL